MNLTICTARDGNHSVYMIQDGREYGELLELARSEKIGATRLSGRRKENFTVLVEWNGKKYVVKKGMRRFRSFDSRFKYRIFGSPFFSVMKKVERAIADGCDRVQRICLVDETVECDREAKTIHVGAWIVLEYLPGEMLQGHKDAKKLLQKIPDAIREIHKYKLTQTDCNPTNFIVSDGKIKVIDLYFFSNPFFGPMCRTVRLLKKIYNLDVPVDGALNRIAFALAETVYRVTETIQRLFHGERPKE